MRKLLLSLLILAGTAQADIQQVLPGLLARPSELQCSQTNSQYFIHGSTQDGADNASMSLFGSGYTNGSDQITLPLAAGYASRRGAFITAAGNELSGDLRLETGNGSASSVLVYLNNSGTGSFKVSKHTATLNTDTDLWLVANSGTLTPGADNTYNFCSADARPVTAYLRNINTLGTFTGTNTDNDFQTDTSDASDTKSVRFTGGGSFNLSGSRSAIAAFYGNEHASNPGKVYIYGGNVATGGIDIETTNSSANIRLRVGSATQATLSNGDATFTGTVKSSRTSDLGWSVVSAANQACTTTCTSAAVFGWDAGAATIVDASDATADKCVCAGAN